MERQSVSVQDTGSRPPQVRVGTTLKTSVPPLAPIVLQVVTGMADVTLFITVDQAQAIADLLCDAAREINDEMRVGLRESAS